MAQSRKSARQQQQKQRELFEKLAVIRGDIQAARGAFNAVREPELVDSCVYRLSALQAQYSYYLRQARGLPAGAREEQICSKPRSSSPPSSSL